MSESKNNNSSSNGCGPMGIIGLGAGLYHGYCDAQGIYIRPNMEDLVTYGPAIASGALGATVGALGGGLVGAIGGAEASDRHKATGAAAGGLAGIVGGAAVGGTLGFIGTGFVTLAGYCAGYATGWMLK